METSTCVADAGNWGNIELAGTNPTYRPLPHRCESHITSRWQQHLIPQTRAAWWRSLWWVDRRTSSRRSAASESFCTWWAAWTSARPSRCDHYVDNIPARTQIMCPFLARDSICYIAGMLSLVCLSVCLSVTRVDQSKTVEVRIMQLSPQSKPTTFPHV